MKTGRIILLAFIAFLLPELAGSLAAAQPLIKVQGGNPILDVTTGTAMGGIVPVSNSTSRIQYRQSAVSTKITVATVCPGQHFNLTVEALNPSIGVAAPAVMLIDGLLDADFITNIPPGGNRAQRAGLRYVSAPTFDQGNSRDLGDDVHVVTYTVVQQ